MHFTIPTWCLFINFYLLGFTLGASAGLLADDALADASTGAKAPVDDSLTSDFMPAPLVEQQLFFAAALFIQQAEDDLPLHFPSASHACAGTTNAKHSALRERMVKNFFINTSLRIGEKKLRIRSVFVTQYIYSRHTEQYGHCSRFSVSRPSFVTIRRFSLLMQHQTHQTYVRMTLRLSLSVILRTATGCTAILADSA